MPPKGERRKQQIITTAKEMFIEKGFQSTHIGQVCEKLNIARGTVYQYFSNKKEILYALLDAVVEKIEDILDQDDLKEILEKNPPKEEVKNLVIERVTSSMAVLIEEPIVIKLIFKDIVGIDAQVIKRVYRSIEGVMRVVAKEIEELQKWGFYKDSVNPRITASMLIGGLMLLIYEYERREMNVLSREVTESLANNYLNGTFNPN